MKDNEDGMHTSRALKTEEKLLSSQPDLEEDGVSSSSPNRLHKKNDLYKVLRKSIKVEKKAAKRGQRIKLKAYDAIQRKKIKKGQHMCTMKKLFGLMVRGVDGKL